MCNLSKGIIEKSMKKGMERGIERGMEKGMAKGMTNGILFSIKNLMETLGLTVEQAMAALKVPENERQQYKNLLEQQ